MKLNAYYTILILVILTIGFLTYRSFTHFYSFSLSKESEQVVPTLSPLPAVVRSASPLSQTSYLSYFESLIAKLSLEIEERNALLNATINQIPSEPAEPVVEVPPRKFLLVEAKNPPVGTQQVMFLLSTKSLSTFHAAGPDAPLDMEQFLFRYVDFDRTDGFSTILYPDDYPPGCYFVIMVYQGVLGGAEPLKFDDKRVCFN